MKPLTGLFHRGGKRPGASRKKRARPRAILFDRYRGPGAALQRLELKMKLDKKAEELGSDLAMVFPAAPEDQRFEVIDASGRVVMTRSAESGGKKMLLLGAAVP